ncbi:MAG: PDC sensor domain-containing protein, partial [Gemmataceae bacterium]
GRQPYMSSVFQNFARKKWVVPFSVAIWSGDDQGSRVIGVLTATVLLGDFGELRSDDRQEFATLVNLSTDVTGKRGLIMQHPSLAALSGQRGATIPDYRLDSDTIHLLEELSRKMRLLQREHQPMEEAMNNQAYQQWSVDYHDPVGDEFSGVWLAEAWPVSLRMRDNRTASTGWVVIVQQRLSEALQPVDSLKAQLFTLGLWAVGVAVVLVTALWAFVGVVLNDSPRSQLVRAFRKRVGLRTSYLSKTASGGTQHSGGTQRTGGTQFSSGGHGTELSRSGGSERVP